MTKNRKTSSFDLWWLTFFSSSTGTIGMFLYQEYIGSMGPWVLCMMPGSFLMVISAGVLYFLRQKRLGSLDFWDEGPEILEPESGFFVGHRGFLIAMNVFLIAAIVMENLSQYQELSVVCWIMFLVWACLYPLGLLFKWLEKGDKQVRERQWKDLERLARELHGKDHI